MIEIHGKYYSYSLKFQATAARRDVTMAEVELTVQDPDGRVESEHDSLNRFLYHKLTDERWITVVVDEAEKMLITVWANEVE